MSPNSRQLLLPSITAPAARIRSTGRASASGTWLRKISEPLVVRTARVSAVSLIDTGTPCSGPSGAPRITVSSAACAARNARSRVTVRNECSRSSVRSIRSRYNSVSSRGDTSFARIRRRCSSAPAKARSASMVISPAAGILIARRHSRYAPASIAMATTSNYASAVRDRRLAVRHNAGRSCVGDRMDRSGGSRTVMGNGERTAAGHAAGHAFLGGKR